MTTIACRVCLRTDVRMQDIPDQLKTFHEEICDFEIVQHKRLKFCNTCAHQVKKFYKFKGQCLRANGLLELWKKQKNKDISEYRKDLPSPSLQITNNSTSFLFECQHGEKTLQNTNVSLDCKRNLILKVNKPIPDDALASDDRMCPKNPKINPKVSLKSNSDKPDSLTDKSNDDVKPNFGLSPTFQSNPCIRPVLRPDSGLRPALNPNLVLKPALCPTLVVKPILSPNSDKRPVPRPNFGIRSEHIKSENGNRHFLTIEPNVLSMPSKPNFRPKLCLNPVFRPNPGLRPAFRPNTGLTLSIQPILPGQKQLIKSDLTLDPDFDIATDVPDPLSVDMNKSAMEIDENTTDIDKNITEIDENTKDIDENTTDVDENTKDIDENTTDTEENTKDSAIEFENIEVLSDEFSMESPINKMEELIKRENNAVDTDSDEYTYEYLDEDIDLLDFKDKLTQKEAIISTCVEEKQNTIEEPKHQEPKIKIIKIESIAPIKQSNKILSEQNENKQANTENFNNKRYVKKTNIQTYQPRPSNFQAIPSFKDKMFRLFDEPYVLDEGVIMNKELFSVIYDKFNGRELRKLATIILEDDRPKLTIYLGQLLRKYNPDYDTVFHVEYLYTEEKKKEEFNRRQLNLDYIRAAFRCKLCYKTYTGQNFLDTHMKMQHNPANQFVCDICSYRMPSQGHLNKHRQSNHQAAYSCKLCPLKTNLMTVMQNHYHTHKGTQYQCPICSKVCFNATTLLNHKRKDHATHVCTACAQQYCSERGLSKHRDTVHKDAPPPDPSQATPCNKCGITFDTRQGYQRHRFIAHKVVNHSAPRRKRFRPSPMDSKERKKKKKISYRTCEVCKEQVFVKHGGALLYNHFQTKHPGVPYHARHMQSRDYLCEQCGKAFNCRATLLDHKNWHTGARPHLCELCPARFHTKDRLWAHREHHRERNHRCEECGKLFKNTTHLAQHMKIHIGDRRYKCEICSKAFLHNGSLKEHVRGVHYNERRVRKGRTATQEI